VLNDRNKPIIFSMARLDRVKNLTGLVELYGRNKRLQELVNLVVVCGDHGNPSKDKEEQAEFKKMFDLIEQYNLNGHIRWISAQMNRVRNGELYRYICDTKGAFVQVTNHCHRTKIHVSVANSFVCSDRGACVCTACFLRGVRADGG
jgi:sucrose synthase